MKTYKTPRIKTIKLDTEELLTLIGSDTPVDAAAARSKRHTGLFDDSDDEGINVKLP